MRRTKLFTVIITAALAVSMCGCANVDGEVSAAPSGEISQQTSEMISSITGGSLDNSVADSETSTALSENSEFPTKCKIHKQTMKQFTEKQLISFFSNTPEKVESRYEGRIEYKTDTETGFVDDEGYLHFATPSGNKFDTICELGFLEENNIEGYEDGELDFATRDEILEQVKTLTQDKLGIAPEDWYIKKFYSVKKETVAMYKEMIIEEASKPVTSDNKYEHEKLNEEVKRLKNVVDNDYYYISLGTRIDNITTYPRSIFYYAPNASNAIIGSKYTIIITKNGIEYVALNNIRETDKASAEEANIIRPDEARTLMRQKIDSVIWDGEVEIYDMKLEYLPIPQNDLGEYFTNFETRPYYAFYHKAPEKFEDTIMMSNRVTYFDAVTGAELGTEWLMTD